jgi:hypothetical protein
MSESEFCFGKRALFERGYDCCGKPERGCTNENPRCAYPNHPHKQFARGEITLEQLNKKMLPSKI